MRALLYSWLRICFKLLLLNEVELLYMIVRKASRGGELLGEMKLMPVIGLLKTRDGNFPIREISCNKNCGSPTRSVTDSDFGGCWGRPSLALHCTGYPTFPISCLERQAFKIHDDTSSSWSLPLLYIPTVAPWI